MCLVGEVVEEMAGNDWTETIRKRPNPFDEDMRLLEHTGVLLTQKEQVQCRMRTDLDKELLQHRVVLDACTLTIQLGAAYHALRSHNTHERVLERLVILFAINDRRTLVAALRNCSKLIKAIKGINFA